MRSVLGALLVSFAILVMEVLPPLGWAVSSYLREPGLRWLYLALFFVLMFLYLVLFGRSIRRGRWIADLAFALVSGHVFSVVSLFVAELILVGGLAGFHGSLSRDGVFDFLVVQLAFPTLLDGWLLLCLAVVGLKVLHARGFFQE